MQNKPFIIKERLHSFSFAWNGMRVLIKNEHNARIHLVISTGVIIAGLIIGLSSTEWLTILTLTAMVFATEMINSALEYLSDFVSPTHSDLIKKVKDLAAGAVLICAIIAFIIGIIIFLPKLMQL